MIYIQHASVKCNTKNRTQTKNKKKRKIWSHLKLAGWVFELYTVGSCGNANGCTLSSENESSVKSRTWNLFRPLKTISRFLGRLLCRCGDFFTSIAAPPTLPPLLWLLRLPIPESADISRCDAWKPFLVVFAACLAFFTSIDWRGAIKLTGTAYCVFGKLDVCNVNFETIVVAACGVGRWLKCNTQQSK